MSRFKKESSLAKWYALRDLKRPNAKQPAYRVLEKEHKMKIFTPMKEKIVTRKGKRVKTEVPFIPDLLFVHDTLEHIDPIVEKTETLQFRYRTGGAQYEPIVVPDEEMERFIYAAGQSESLKYYFPDEITPQMYGRRIRIVGGNLDGYEGCLITTRGSKVKRLLVELKGLLAVGVEVNPEYIQFVV